MTTTITLNDDVLPDLKLIKRVHNHKSMTEVIRGLMERAGYSQERLDYMSKFLKEWSE